MRDLREKYDLSILLESYCNAYRILTY
ncbi:protein of unknown function [Thermococcus nautili]|nr:protein of unknown function [Thermococcus nautili]